MKIINTDVYKTLINIIITWVYFFPVFLNNHVKNSFNHSALAKFIFIS